MSMWSIQKVRMAADIEKVFLQVGLQSQEKDVTGFTWLKDINHPPIPENLKTYRLTRVIYGVNSSHLLLGATIKHDFEETLSASKFSNDSENQHQTVDISKDKYIDNLVTGTNNENEAVQLYKETKGSFKTISMNLRDWTSNAAEVNIMIPDYDRVKETVIKVLGLQWDTESDRLKITVTKFQNIPPVKTKATSTNNYRTSFDTMGYLSPVTMKIRLFLQKLWNEGKE